MKNKISQNDVVFGDSPIDIEAAIANGLSGYFVKTGLFTVDDVKKCTYVATLYDGVKHLWKEKLCNLEI